MSDSPLSSLNKQLNWTDLLIIYRIESQGGLLLLWEDTHTQDSICPALKGFCAPPLVEPAQVKQTGEIGRPCAPRSLPPPFGGRLMSRWTRKKKKKKSSRDVIRGRTFGIKGSRVSREERTGGVASDSVELGLTVRL